MKMRNNTFKIVMTALMMCLIMVATMFIRIPIPVSYTHLDVYKRQGLCGA